MRIDIVVLVAIVVMVGFVFTSENLGMATFQSKLNDVSDVQTYDGDSGGASANVDNRIQLPHSSTDENVVQRPIVERPNSQNNQEFKKSQVLNLFDSFLDFSLYGVDTRIQPLVSSSACIAESVERNDSVLFNDCLDRLFDTYGVYGPVMWAR